MKVENITELRDYLAAIRDEVSSDHPDIHKVQTYTQLALRLVEPHVEVVITPDTLAPEKYPDDGLPWPGRGYTAAGKPPPGHSMWCRCGEYALPDGKTWLEAGRHGGWDCAAPDRKR